MSVLSYQAGIDGRENYVEGDFDDDGNMKEPNSLVLQINLIGTINTAKLGIFYLRKNIGGGSIVLSASTAGMSSVTNLR